MNDYQHVLCVVDLSDENYLLSKRAADLAGRYSATLHLLHVVEQLPSEVSSNIVLPDQQNIEDYLVENAIKVLDKLKGELEFPGANSSVVSGSTKIEIIDFVEKNNIDLVVIGRHGRHGITRLLGSTASAVLHHAQCDVLAVHLGK